MTRNSPRCLHHSICSISSLKTCPNKYCKFPIKIRKIYVVQEVLPRENEDLQEVVIIMEKQLHLSKSQAAHLRENFRMVVGDNFDPVHELKSLRADIADQVCCC